MVQPVNIFDMYQSVLSGNNNQGLDQNALSQLANNLHNENRRKNLSSIYQNALSPDGNINQQAILAGLAQEDPEKFIDTYGKFQDMNNSSQRFEAEMKMKDLQIKKEENSMKKEMFDNLFNRLYRVNSSSSYETWKRDYYNSGAHKFYGNVEDKYSPEYVKSLIKEGLTIKEQLELEKQQLSIQGQELTNQKTQQQIVNEDRELLIKNNKELRDQLKFNSDQEKTQADIDKIKSSTELNNIKIDEERRKSIKNKHAFKISIEKDIHTTKNAIKELKRLRDVQLNKTISAVEKMPSTKGVSAINIYDATAVSALAEKQMESNAKLNPTVVSAYQYYTTLEGAVALRTLAKMKADSPNGASGLGNASNREFGTLSMKEGLASFGADSPEDRKYKTMAFMLCKPMVLDVLNTFKENINEDISFLEQDLQKYESSLQNYSQIYDQTNGISEDTSNETVNNQQTMMNSGISNTQPQSNRRIIDPDKFQRFINEKYGQQ